MCANGYGIVEQVYGLVGVRGFQVFIGGLVLTKVAVGNAVVVVVVDHHPLNRLNHGGAWIVRFADDCDHVNQPIKVHVHETQRLHHHF
jgi:hypothetical protein